MPTKIGLRDIAAMQPNSILWDSTVRGFNARRQFSDVVTFNVFYRTQDGIQRWHKIGRHGIFKPDVARQEARRILMAVALGQDPSGERFKLRNSMTVSDLCVAYIADMEAGRINGKKESTIKSDKNRIHKHINPNIGKYRVVTITQENIENFMHLLSPGSAKRIMGLTGAIFAYAIKRKLRPDNLVRGIETPKDRRKLRRLSETEYPQLWHALENKDNEATDIFRLLAVSGWRSSEARCLKWSELDLDRRVATLTDTKAGLSVRPLCVAAMEIIKRQPEKSPYVFDYQRGKPIGRLTQCWAKLGMDKTVTPHTLRHSFASLAADMGLADHTIAALLGHSRQTITSRYMHLADRALIEAADMVANETLKLMRR
jgi:site-specific recombinase XerD